MSPSEYRTLLEELKNILKNRKMTYRDLGEAAGLSEAGIKRIFGSSDGKISTLSKICGALGFSFIDLVNSSKLNTKKVKYFTKEQDQYFSENFDAYIFFNELVIRRKSVSEIKATHLLTDPMVERYLLRLEKIGIIKRTVKGQIRLLLHSPIGIKKDGPLRKKLQQNFTNGLIANAFSSEPGQGSQLETREWAMSFKNALRFKEDLCKLIESYDQIAARDDSVLSPQELTTLSVVTCLLEDSPYGIIQRQKS